MEMENEIIYCLLMINGYASLIFAIKTSHYGIMDLFTNTDTIIKFNKRKITIPPIYMAIFGLCSFPYYFITNPYHLFVGFFRIRVE